MKKRILKIISAALAAVAVGAAGGQNEIEKVAAGLGSDPYFLKTSIHINEYNYLNDKTGSNYGLNSSYNYNTGASKTLDAVMEIVERTTVQWVSWAQFMESTGGYDPYGLIEQTGGHVKAPFNSIKIYNDMPVGRYTVSADRDNGVNSLVSAEGGKISVLLWNTDDTEKQIGVEIKNPGYESGVRRVYRIDAEHASWFDDNDKEELEAAETARVSADGDIWYGQIPSYGVVYITLNQNGEKDFDSFEKRTADFADAVKVQYYYEDRFRGIKGCRDAWEDYSEGIRGSYSHFDRNTWTMYLGMGDCEGYGKAQRYYGQGRANGAVTAEGLPESFRISLQTSGDLKQINENPTLRRRQATIRGY